MLEDIQKHLIDEYKQNNQPWVNEVAVVCEATLGSSYIYKDMTNEEVSLDETREFAEYIVLPYRYVKNAKTIDVAFDNFVSDIFDYDEGYKKSIENEYKAHGERMRTVDVTGIQIPVLYKNRNLPYEKQVDQIIEDALELYEIIEQSLIDKGIRKEKSPEKEVAEVKKIKADFYQKRKKELAGVAAGLTILGFLAFGGKSAKTEVVSQNENRVETVQAKTEKKLKPEIVVSFEEAKKMAVSPKVEVAKKKQEVRAKLAEKKEQKAEVQNPTIAKIETPKIEMLKVSPLNLSDIKLQNISAHLEVNKQERFEKIVQETFAKEGGYGTTAKEAAALRAKGEKVAVIDQATNFGVTNPLLKSLKKRFPEKYGKFPSDVKHLTEAQSVKVVEYFYEEFSSHKIENESVAKMLFDASYNHKPKTFKKFFEAGIKEVEKNRTQKTSNKSLKSWEKKADYLNACTNSELKSFYDKFAEERLAFMNDGRVDKFKGIITRAENYIGEFKSDKSLKQAISIDHAEKIVGNGDLGSRTFAAFNIKGKTNS
ncbi:MAG: glycosyl hydrolase 108 family protein [Alphaproteobacteria bacterium]